MSIQSPILHNFESSTLSNASALEKLGMFGLRTAARLTKPIEYVGYSKAAGLVKTLLPSKRMVRTQLFEDTLFEYPYADGYWSRLVYNGDLYAKSEEDFLRAIQNVDYAYIDCGANFGYMSAIVTSKAYGGKPSIAIEADPETFKLLKNNASLNHDRFEIRHNAIFSKSGDKVNIYGDKHEARSILDENGNRNNDNDSSSSNVETLALNDLQPWLDRQNTKATLLKLDVEGVEIDAMKGASQLLKRELLVSYEDHGNDKTNEISKYFMEDLNMKVFLSEARGCREMHTLADITAAKRFSRVGYDFLATNSDLWIDAITNCKYD